MHLGRQKGGGCVIFRARIIGDELISPAMVQESVKVNPTNNCDFIYDDLVDWL